MNADAKKLIDIISKNTDAGYDLRINGIEAHIVDGVIISDNYAIAINLNDDIQIIKQDLMELYIEDEEGTEYIIEFTVFKKIIY